MLALAGPKVPSVRTEMPRQDSPLHTRPAVVNRVLCSLDSRTKWVTGLYCSWPPLAGGAVE